MSAERPTQIIGHSMDAKRNEINVLFFRGLQGVDLLRSWHKGHPGVTGSLLCEVLI